MNHTTHRRLAGLLGLCAAVLSWGLLAPASAIPGGGAGPATPGTTAGIATAQVPVGGVVKFTVTGFPGGETLYVKIDDEKFCTAPPFGACVYHQQKIGANGTVNGSMTLPAGLPPGTHTLRFLASETVMENGQEAIRGYTRASPAFTVTAAESGADAGKKAGAGADADKPAPAAPAGPGAPAGAESAPAESAAEPGAGSVLAAPGAAAPSAAAPGASATQGAVPTQVLVAAPTQAATDDDLVPMPWIGLYVLLGCLLVSSLMTTIAVFRRR